MTNDFNMPVTPHRLELMDRAHLTVSGVEDVERFDESGVIMTTSAGSTCCRTPSKPCRR